MLKLARNFFTTLRSACIEFDDLFDAADTSGKSDSHSQMCICMCGCVCAYACAYIFFCNMFVHVVSIFVRVRADVYKCVDIYVRVRVMCLVLCEK